jgi:hypothetical protein
MKPFKLDNHEKIKPGFIVPENYFENFQATMMQQIQLGPKVIQLQQNRKSWWYAAAAVLILALSIPAINTFTTTNNQADIAALDSYFVDAGIPDDQIVELLETEDIDKIKIEYELEDAAIEDALQIGTIENYILD